MNKGKNKRIAITLDHGTIEKLKCLKEKYGHASFSAVVVMTVREFCKNKCQCNGE